MELYRTILLKEVVLVVAKNKRMVKGSHSISKYLCTAVACLLCDIFQSLLK